MAPTDITAPAHTADLGLFIRDMIEDRQLTLHDHSDPEMPARADTAEVVMVDCSDANNLIAYLDNGQAFTIRIIAGARR